MLLHINHLFLNKIFHSSNYCLWLNVLLLLFSCPIKSEVIFKMFQVDLSVVECSNQKENQFLQRLYGSLQQSAQYYDEGMKKGLKIKKFKKKTF